MDFALSEEQELLQETVRQFVANECPAPRVRELFDGSGHDPTLWKGLAELGVTGLAVPEAFGGAGLEVLDLALVAEALGAGAFPGPFLGHALATLALTLGGSEAQKERCLPRLAAGESVGTVGLAEPGGAWDPSTWSLAFEGGRLQGAKDWVPAGGLADLLVVGVAGGGLVLVERSAEGLGVDPIDPVDRTRPLDAVRFENTPAEALGEADPAVARRVRDAGLVLLAADAFGGADRLVAMSVEYAKTREQFGQPIAQFQAVKHQLADMALEVKPTRALYWFAAHAFDHLPDEAERAAAVAKSHITDRALQVARAAVEVHGGLGFTWECDVQIWFKRMMFDRLFLGTPEEHRERSAELAGW